MHDMNELKTILGYIGCLAWIVDVPLWIVYFYMHKNQFRSKRNRKKGE